MKVCEELLKEKLQDIKDTINKMAKGEKTQYSPEDVESLIILRSVIKRELTIIQHIMNSPLDSIGLTLDAYNERLKDSKIYIMKESEYENMCKASDKLDEILKIIIK